MSFCLFSFCTKDTPYEAEIDQLKKTCKNFKVPLVTSVVPKKTSWVENTMMKPSIILSALQSLKQYSSIVWVDADARIQSYPDYFVELDKSDIDFSVFQMGSKSRITSGTIFMRRSENVMSFVKEWKNICKTTTERLGDQHSLRQLIREDGYSKFNIKYKSLPYSYCYIYDDSLRMLAPEIPPLLDDPVIMHTQASRKYRNKSL